MEPKMGAASVAAKRERGVRVDSFGRPRAHLSGERVVERNHLLEPAVLLRLVPAALAVADEEDLKKKRSGRVRGGTPSCRHEPLRRRKRPARHLHETADGRRPASEPA